MRIGFFTATYYPTPDGVSHYLRDVKAELERRGNEVHVFSFNGDRSESNVHVLRSVPFLAYSQYSVPISPFPVATYRKALELHFDLIHIHDPFMGSLGYRVARASGIPVVATFHTDFMRMKESVSIPLKNRLFDLTWRYNLYLFRKCSEVFAPSRKTVEFLRSHGVGHASELPLFVDTEKFKPEKSSKGKFTIQYIGRITRDKGVYRILDIAEKLGNRDDMLISISGTGPEEESLNKHVEKRGIDSLINFTGYVDEKDKIELLHSADLFLYPSETDTFGISVLEALSSGIPCMVPENFPLAHYNDLGNLGLMEVDISKPSAVAAMIVELSENRSKLEHMGKQARDFADSNFSMHTHCDALLSTYSNLIDAARLRGSTRPGRKESAGGE